MARAFIRLWLGIDRATARPTEADGGSPTGRHRVFMLTPGDFLDPFSRMSCNRCNRGNICNQFNRAFTPWRLELEGSRMQIRCILENAMALRCRSCALATSRGICSLHPSHAKTAQILTVRTGALVSRARVLHIRSRVAKSLRGFRHQDPSHP